MDFKDPSLHVLDFVLALQQSGLRGELVFEGRAARSDVESLTRNEPLQQIEVDYWVEHQVEWSRIFAGEGGTIGEFIEDNFYCFSYNPINTAIVRERYYDLHISGAASQWFKKVASTFMGRHTEQENERVKQHERDKKTRKEATVNGSR